MEKRTLITITALVTVTYVVTLMLFSKFIEVDSFQLSVLLLALCALTTLYIKLHAGNHHRVKLVKLDSEEINLISNSLQSQFAELHQNLKEPSIYHQQNYSTLTADEIHSRATTLVKLIMPETEQQHSGESCLKLMMTCKIIVSTITDRDWNIFLEIEKNRGDKRFKRSLISLSDLVTETEHKQQHANA